MTKNSPHIHHTHHTHRGKYDHSNRSRSMISVSFPPPDRRIILVGFIETSNGCRCACHRDGCGNLVVERIDNGVGMELRLRMEAANELACYVMKPDGTDGCRVSFAAKKYAAGENGLRLDGEIVRIVDVLLPDNPNRTVRQLYHHNRGYAVGEIVAFA